MDTTPWFPAIFTRETILLLPVCFPGKRRPSKMESTCQGQNLLLKEQNSLILVGWEANKKTAELLPLTVYSNRKLEF